jgi:hypothetical protein
LIKKCKPDEFVCMVSINKKFIKNSFSSSSL